MKNYLNKKFCTAATLLIAVFGFSQNVIKVNSSNSKTSIYTLKKGEELDTQEAEITFSGNGTNYEFVTELNDKYYLHSNKFHVGPYNRTPRKIGKGIYILENIEWNDFKLVRDEEYILDIKTGKKSGPYQNITTFYNYNEGDENQDGALDGDEQLFSSLLSYESKGKTFLRNLKTNSTLGPYDSVLAFAPQKSSIDFVYKNAGNFYVSLSGKINGPFMKFNQVYSQYKYFWILTDQSGKANVVVNHEMIGTINNLNEMNSYRINNFYGAYSTLFISEKNGIYPGYFYLSNGQKVPGDNSESELSYVFETTNKGWVKLEATDAIRKKDRKSTRLNSSH